MSLQRLARVTDPISHNDEWLAIGGAVIAGAALGAFLFFTGGLGAAVLPAAIGAIGNAAGTGLILGDWLRGMGGRSVWGHIEVGARTVHVGPTVLGAAFASTLSSVDCHGGAYVAQGSSSVWVEGMRASRAGDGTSCGGLIEDGCGTVFAAGEPTMADGAAIGNEKHGHLYRIAYALSAIGAPGFALGRQSIPDLMRKGGDLRLAGVVLSSAEIVAALGSLFEVPGSRATGTAANTLNYDVRLRRGVGENRRAWIGEHVSRLVGVITRNANTFWGR